MLAGCYIKPHSGAPLILVVFRQCEAIQQESLTEVHEPGAPKINWNIDVVLVWKIPDPNGRRTEVELTAPAGIPIYLTFLVAADARCAAEGELLVTDEWR